LLKIHNYKTINYIDKVDVNIDNIVFINENDVVILVLLKLKFYEN